MVSQKTIVCAFCQGTGQHPHFTGTCPVCKGRGENTVKGSFVTCQDCHGSGQKGGTTLTCYACGGLGVVPDTAEIFKKAKKEIKEAQQEMEKERQDFKPPKKRKESESEDPKGRAFCQCCAKKVEKSSTLKVCLECFKKIKKI